MTSEQQPEAAGGPSPSPRPRPRGAPYAPTVLRRAGRRLAGTLRRAGRYAGRLRRTRAAGRCWVALCVLTISLVGVVVGTLLGAQAETDVGPFRAEMSIRPSLTGGTEVGIPPLGSLHLASHRGPIQLKVNLGSLDQGRTEALLDDPTGITTASRNAVDDVTDGVLRLGLRALGSAVAAALLLAALVFRDVRRVAWSGGLSLVVAGGSLAVAAGTVRAGAIGEPRYEGLLVNAPAVVGDARRIADNYGRYAEQLQALVGNVSRIYSTVSKLPVYEPAANTTRLLHVSDLHLNPTAWSMIRTVVQQFEIDAVIDTGDIVDWGSEPETSYVAPIGELTVPYLFVRGNHDSSATAAAVARHPNAIVLENSVATVKNLAIAGIGDPQFTPDKSQEPPAEPADEPAVSPLVRSGQELATTIRASQRPIDIALVHDPAMAAPLSGTCPLVLSGHLHQRRVSMLEPAGVPTRLMVSGSTGGAGLRGLESDEPTPLAMSVLYFDEKRSLKAYDDIEVGGTGRAEVTLERKVIGTDPEPASSGRPSAGPSR